MYSTTPSPTYLAHTRSRRICWAGGGSTRSPRRIVSAEVQIKRQSRRLEVDWRGAVAQELPQL